MYTTSYTILLFLIYNMTFASKICFHGTCDFTCHCDDQSLCRDNVTCDCDKRFTGARWSGGGCQIGNVVFGKNSTLNYAKTNYRGTNVASNCNDGNRSSDDENNTCCSVQAREGSSWTVDLGGTFVLKNVYVYKSKTNLDLLNRLGIYARLPSGSYEECGTTGTSNEHPKSVYCSNKLATEVKLDKTIYEELQMCEVVVIGYEYKECVTLNGEYYYGPGCFAECHCAEQCDRISSI